MEAERVRLLLEVLSPAGAIDRARRFARSVRRSVREPGGLLVVGTPGYEPWHFTAHLTDEVSYAGLPELVPTLVRWTVPTGAPAHLAVPLDRLAAARRGETLLVVTEEQAPERLLERVMDAKKVGATIFTMDVGDPELTEIAHDALIVPGGSPPQRGAPGETPRETQPGMTDGELTDVVPADLLTFDLTQHVVSVAAGERPPSAAGRARDRLARFLDIVSGPAPNDRR